MADNHNFRVKNGLEVGDDVAVTGNIAVSGTVDGVDIAARDAVLTSTTTTAGAALPKAGGTMTGALTIEAGSGSTTPLVIGSSSSTNYTAQRWVTNLGSSDAYIIAYGGHNTNNGGNFAVKNIRYGGEIYFELDNSVQPLRLTSTGATFAGEITANGGVVVDTMTLDAATLTATGAFTVDAVGDIILDADGGDIQFKDGGTEFGRVFQSGNNMYIKSTVSDGDIIFQGNDGGVSTTVLSLDMSAAGAATFTGEITANGGISLVDNKKLTFGTDDLEIYHDGNHSYINDVGTGNLFIRGANVVLTTAGGTKYLEGGANILRLYHTGNEKLRTSAAGIFVTGGMTAGTLTAGAGSITDTSGAISFGNENLSTTGTFSSGVVTATGGNSGQWNTAYGWGNHASAGYTNDQTDAEIRAAVEAATDSNVFTDADHTKLGGIATNANNYVLPSGYATESYVNSEITTLIGGAPSTLNDLNELAAAINDDANYNTTLTTALATKLPKTGGAMTGAITTSSTFDGRNVSVDGAKLDGIEASADVTDTTNVVAALTAGTNITIAANGTIASTDTNTTYSVGDGGLSQNNFTDADHSKLNAIEASATADQTNAEIRTAVEAATDSNVFTDADHSKLNAIEASADVTDTTNVVAALTAGTNITIAANGTIASTDTNTTYSVGDGGLTTNNFTNADHTKLDGIAASANNYTLPTNISAASLDISGDIDVDGTTNLDVVDIDGAVDMASTLTVASNILVGGTVDGRDVAADGTKLDGIATSANNYVLPSGYATEAYVNSEITTLIGGAPSTLNDLNELAAAINDDANYNTTLTTALATKLPKSGGAMTGAITTNSTFDGRNVSVDGTKLDGIAAGATNTVTNATHTGEVTGSGALTIANNVVDAGNLKVTGNGSTSQFLRSDGDGTFTWATPTDTNTTYSVGDGGLSQINFTSADHTKLNGIEASATADQTAAEILTAIKTVDGSGSGLDADLLDGQQGSYYANESARKSVPSSGNYQITNSTSPQTLGTGYLRHDFLNSSGPPGSAYRSVLSISSYTSGSQWTQLSFNYNQGINTPIYFRQNQYNGSTWSSWHQLWDSANDGSGSGLDADLLDGQHGSYYYPASNPNGYTNDQTAAEIKALLVNGLTATHLAAGSVGGSEIGNDVVNSQHYAAGSIDNEHIADNAINSEHYADNSIDALHLNVSGNGTTSQYLRSDGDGTMSWVTPPNTTYSVGNGGLTQQNFTNADHTKLNGIETGATADQTAAQILAALKTVDGNGSAGVNAGTLDGHALTSASTGSTVVERDSSGDINARLFRSEYDGTNSSIGFIMTQVDTASNNYIRPSTPAQLRASLNVENGATADQTAAQILTAIKTVDGAGSGLNADLLDGQHGSYYSAAHSHPYLGSTAKAADSNLLDGLDLHTGRNNVANRVVRTEANGYINASYINTDIGNNAIGTNIAHVYASQDGYIRKYTKSDFKVLMGLTRNPYDRRTNYTANAAYHTGVLSHGAENMNTTFNRGSGFTDNWGSPAGGPPSGTHFNGFQSLHYTSSATYHHGMQLVMSAGNPSHTYLRGWWANGGSGYAWQKIWTDGNDGSGSGLDADTLDGVEASGFLSTSSAATNNHYIRNGSPTVYFRDTDHRSAMIHVNANTFYVLRGSGTDSNSWATYAGRWPISINLSNNDATFGGNVTAYSDQRLKENVKPVGNSMDMFDQIEAKRFDWIANGKHDIGFIAQNVREAGLTEFVKDTEDRDPGTGVLNETYLTLDYSRMVTVLWDVVKELKTEIEELKAEIEELKA